jgi:hypothetical protein
MDGRGMVGRGPVTCPPCGQPFQGTWHAVRTPEPQECPRCGHVVTDACCPDFKMEPVKVYLTRETGTP